jgi:hypothetical protein
MGIRFVNWNVRRLCRSWPLKIVAGHEELHDLCSLVNRPITSVIKSRRMGWAGHVARMGEKRSTYRISLGKPKR